MAKDAPASPNEQREQRDDVERAVRCARCGHALTTEKQRIEVHGRHAHTFMNPSGVIFDVRCYGDVPGAACEGVPDSATSWFPGTAWIYAHCAQCKCHVGWRYVRIDEPEAGRVFFGLIADTLA
jgi:hypothetical protein